MKRLTLLLAILSSMLLISACGQSGPLYVPGNPSQMAVPPSETSTSEESEEDKETADSEAPESD